jgi:hypothetical protein
MPSPASAEPKFEFLRGALGTVKQQCLSRWILFGEHSLRRAVSNFLEHFHHERNHQGRGNLLLFPTGTTKSATQATAVRCHKRLAPHEFFGHMTTAAAKKFYYADSFSASVTLDGN